MVELRTERLRLRPARAEDLTAIHAVLSDPRATAFWSTLPHRELDQSKEWLDSMLASAPGEGEDFIVEQEGQAIGKAGFHRFPEIGFILHPDHWGLGLAREAVSAAIARGFAVHRLERIEADVDPRNQASLRLLTRLGFTERERKARTWQIGDQWCDSVYLHLDASAWAADPSGSRP